MMCEYDGMLKGHSHTHDQTQTFILKSTLDNPKKVPEVRFVFTTEQESPNGRSSGITFNRDGKHYTPAFLPRLEETQSTLNDSLCRQIFEKKIVDSVPGRSPPCQPKPQSNYCHVCKETFKDYSKHIIHPIHVKNIKASKCSAFMEELIVRVKREGSMVVSEPRKRRKLNQSAVEEQKLLLNSNSQKDQFFNEYSALGLSEL